MHNGNYETVLKKIKGHINKWKHIPYSWIGRLNIIKLLILPKVIYRFNEILIKIPMTFFYRNTKIILKFISTLKTYQIAKESWKRTQLEGLTLPNFKFYKTKQNIAKQCGNGIETDIQTNGME